ncbi:MAG: transporter [Xanthomonadales bacterium]|nr:transporter [Xanthomonadales bacterium]MDL1869498.1 transporter [Gammaproteobacteria bacterium PRO6]
MQHSHRRNQGILALAALPFALAMALGAGEAQAAAFQLSENNAIGLGRAFAGSAAAPSDCSVVVNNPAAMSQFHTSCLQADLTLINFSTQFHGSGTDLLGRPLTGDDGGNGGATVPVPATHYIRPINDQFVFGAALTVPYGFQTEYHDRWMGRYLAQTTKLQSPAITLSGSWRASDEFSVGLSFVIQRTTATLGQAINLGTILAQPTNGAWLPQEADGRGTLTGKDWGFGWGLGLLWKPTDSDRIGLNFRSQIDHVIDGKAKFEVPSNVLPYFNGAFVNTGGKADFNTPAYARASWWHTANDRLSFGVDVGFTHWSSFERLDIVYANPAQAMYNRPTIFGFEDTWFFSVGADYRLNDRWTLRAGVAYDQTPTVDEYRDPRVPDGSRKWIAFGVDYQYSDNMRINAGFVHLFVDDGKINHPTSTFDTLVGHFESYGNLLGVSGQMTF